MINEDQDEHGKRSTVWLPLLCQGCFFLFFPFSYKYFLPFSHLLSFFLASLYPPLKMIVTSAEVPLLTISCSNSSSFYLQLASSFFLTSLDLFICEIFSSLMIDDLQIEDGKGHEFIDLGNRSIYRRRRRVKIEELPCLRRKVLYQNVVIHDGTTHDSDTYR